MAKKKPSSSYKIGERVVKDTKNGRRITMQRVKPHGPGGNLMWKILKNIAIPGFKKKKKK